MGKRVSSESGKTELKQSLTLWHRWFKPRESVYVALYLFF